MYKETKRRVFNSDDTRRITTQYTELKYIYANTDHIFLLRRSHVQHTHPRIFAIFAWARSGHNAKLAPPPRGRQSQNCAARRCKGGQCEPHLFMTMRFAELTLSTQPDGQSTNSGPGIVIQRDVFKCAVGENLKTGTIKLGTSYLAHVWGWPDHTCSALTRSRWRHAERAV